MRTPCPNYHILLDLITLKTLHEEYRPRKFCRKVSYLHCTQNAFSSQINSDLDTRQEIFTFIKIHVTAVWIVTPCGYVGRITFRRTVLSLSSGWSASRLKAAWSSENVVPYYFTTWFHNSEFRDVNPDVCGDISSVLRSEIRLAGGKGCACFGVEEVSNRSCGQKRESHTSGGTHPQTKTWLENQDLPKDILTSFISLQCNNHLKYFWSLIWIT